MIIVAEQAELPDHATAIGLQGTNKPIGQISRFPHVRAEQRLHCLHVQRVGDAVFNGLERNLFADRE
jgi:hypothetical protein